MGVKLVKVAWLLASLAAAGICFSSAVIAQEEAAPQTDQPTTNSHWLHDFKTDCWIYYPAGTLDIVSVSWSGSCTDHQASGPGTFTITRTIGVETLTGTFDKGRMEGPGVIVGTNGTREQGSFRGGLLTGEGTIAWPGGAHYEGSIVNGHTQGKGKLAWPNGDFYEGEFFGGAIQGDGKITNIDGSTYEGRFVNAASAA